MAMALEAMRVNPLVAALAAAVAWLGAVAPVGALAQVPAAPEAAASSAGAETSVPLARPDRDRLRWVVGGRLVHEPTYEGSSNQHWHVTPLWALRWGRWRLSSGAVGGLLAEPADAGSGATVDLVQGQRWSVSAGLRVDGGRPSSDDARLAGLADVRRTVRLRVAARGKLSEGWQVDAQASTDALGRGGGSSLGLGLARTGRFGEASEWSAGAGLTLGDRQFVDARFGVPVAAATAGRPAFQGRGGLYSAGLGAGTTTALGPHWVLLTGVRVNHLLGSPADSPLTLRRTGVALSVGLAWRSR